MLESVLGNVKSPGEAVAVLTQGRQFITAVHPLVAVGITGMFANALSFLPIGRLDGGRVAMSIAGRRAASAISTSTLLGLAVSFISNSSPIPLFWGIFVVLFQRFVQYQHFSPR